MIKQFIDHCCGALILYLSKTQDQHSSDNLIVGKPKKCQQKDVTTFSQPSGGLVKELWETQLVNY